MIIERLGLVARRENRKDLQSALFFLLGPTSVESGCLSCNLLQDLSNPNGLRFECLWKTEADLVRHLRSEVYRQLLILMELSAETPSVQFHTVSETQGLEFIHAARQQEHGKRLEFSDSNFKPSNQEKIL